MSDTMSSEVCDALRPEEFHYWPIGIEAEGSDTYFCGLPRKFVPQVTLPDCQTCLNEMNRRYPNV